MIDASYSNKVLNEFVENKLFMMKYFKEGVTIEELETLIEDIQMAVQYDIDQAIEALE